MKVLLCKNRCCGLLGLTRNLFLSFQRDVGDPDEVFESKIGRIVGKIGPSMLLTSLSESVAFLLGKCN